MPFRLEEGEEGEKEFVAKHWKPLIRSWHQYCLLSHTMATQLDVSCNSALAGMGTGGGSAAALGDGAGGAAGGNNKSSGSKDTASREAAEKERESRAHIAELEADVEAIRQDKLKVEQEKAQINEFVDERLREIRELKAKVHGYEQIER